MLENEGGPLGAYAHWISTIFGPHPESISSYSWGSPTLRADESFDKVRIQIKMDYSETLNVETRQWTLTALEINCKWEKTRCTHISFRSRK